MMARDSPDLWFRPLTSADPKTGFRPSADPRKKKTDKIRDGYKSLVCRAQSTVFQSVGHFFQRQVAENHSGAISFWSKSVDF